MGPVCSTSVSHLPQLRNVSWKRTGTIKVTDKEGNRRFMKSHNELEKTRSRRKEGSWRTDDEQGWQYRSETELIKREKITKDTIKMKGEGWCTRRKASIIRRGRQTGTKERKMIFIFLTFPHFFNHHLHKVTLHVIHSLWKKYRLAWRRRWNK